MDEREDTTPNDVECQKNQNEIPGSKKFQYKDSELSESVITASSITYIILMLVIATIIFIISAVREATIYAEIYIFILMAVSLIYLNYLLITIYLNKRRLKKLNNNDLSTYAYLNNTQTNMLYLKIGACVFLLGILVHSCLLIMYELTFLTSDCKSYFLIVFEFSVPIFSLFMLIFNLKFSTIVINSNIMWARFFVIHLIGTSISIGIYKIIREAQEALHGLDYYRTIDMQCSRTILSLDEIYKSFSPYVFPFIIEFYILNAGIFTMTWFRISKIYNSVSLKSSHEMYVDFTGSHRGFLSGFILVALTIIFIILSFVITAERDYFQLGLTIDEIFELVVFVVISITVIIALVQTSKLSINEEHVNRTDDVLLFIGVPGILIQSVLCLIPAMLNGAVVIVCNSLFQIIQVLLQTPFIISRLRSHCSGVEQLKKKPGRDCVTFLAIANISLWIFYAFSNHGVGIFQYTSALYTETGWKILYYLTLPFVMFYRFHSSVCLAHIWKHSYVKNV